MHASKTYVGRYMQHTHTHLALNASIHLSANHSIRSFPFPPDTTSLSFSSPSFCCSLSPSIPSSSSTSPGSGRLLSSPRMRHRSTSRCCILGIPESWVSSRSFSSCREIRVEASSFSKRQPPSPSNCSRWEWYFLSTEEFIPVMQKLHFGSHDYKCHIILQKSF